MVVVGKLVDGTEIIGELTGETENGFQIANPLQIIYKYTMSSTVPVVSFARFMMFADQREFGFQKVDFMVVAQAVPEMTSAYKKLVIQMIPQDKESSQTPGMDEQLPSNSKDEFYKAFLQSLEHEDMTKH